MGGTWLAQSAENLILDPGIVSSRTRLGVEMTLNKQTNKNEIKVEQPMSLQLQTLTSFGHYLTQGSGCGQPGKH